MHRTDATDFDPDIGNGNRGFKETPPGNETVAASNFWNAVQEEVSQVIEDAGLTLRVSGAADTAALWGQLSPAIQILIDRKGVIANAVAFGLTQTPGQGAANKTALDNAFASSTLVYIPAGTYEIIGNIVLPDGAVLLGDNGISRLVAKANNTWTLTDKNIRIIGINFGHDGTFNNTLVIGHTFERFTIIEHCIFDGVSYDPIFIVTSTPNEGVIRITNCLFNGVNRAIEINSGGTSSPRIIAEGNRFVSCEIVHFEPGANAFKFYKHNRFDSCTIRIFDVNTFFEHNEFTGTTIWFFDACVGCMIRSNVFAATPTVNLNNSPRFHFIDNFSASGILTFGKENVRGIFTEHTLSGSQVIGATSSAAVIFQIQVDVRMSFHSNYITDDPYNSSTGLFTNRGLGSGRIRINCQIIIDEVPANDINTFLRVNGTKKYAFMKSLLGGTFSVHRFDGEIILNVGDIFDVLCENNTGSSINVLGSPSQNTVIVAEGL